MQGHSPNVRQDAVLGKTGRKYLQSREKTGGNFLHKLGASQTKRGMDAPGTAIVIQAEMMFIEHVVL